MKNKTTLILLGLLLITSLYAINSKHNEVNLRKKLAKLTSDKVTHVDSLIIKKKIPNIDSLLIKGDYKNALNAYQEQFEVIADNYKEIVKFRIDVANQFINLKQEQHKVTPNLKNYSSQKKNTLVKTEENQLANNDLKSETSTIQQKITPEEKSKNEYLTFKSSKKHLLHYVGEVTKNKANGHGIAVFDTGSRYEGDWKNNLREGQGNFYWTDGQHYQGEYKNDLRHGTGTYFWPNGEKYIGQWKKDKRHGTGTFYYKNGKVVEGIWKKDKLIEKNKNK